MFHWHKVLPSFSEPWLSVLSTMMASLKFVYLFYFSLYILDIIIQPNSFFITVIYIQIIEVYYSNVNKWKGNRVSKGDARKGEREMMMAGGKRCDGTWISNVSLTKGIPLWKTLGQGCSTKCWDTKVAWMLVAEGSINYLCKHQLDVAFGLPTAVLSRTQFGVLHMVNDTAANFRRSSQSDTGHWPSSWPGAIWRKRRLLAVETVFK